ncbi:hypothetical protein ES703_72185 [subsurface metagenome]
MTTKYRIPQQNKVKQGDYQAAGSPLLCLSPGGSPSLTPGLKLKPSSYGRGQLYYTTSDKPGLDFKPVLGEVNTRLLVPLANLVPVAFFYN